jgi:hypothetical protein
MTLSNTKVKSHRTLRESLIRIIFPLRVIDYDEQKSAKNLENIDPLDRFEKIIRKDAEERAQ